MVKRVATRVHIVNDARRVPHPSLVALNPKPLRNPVWLASWLHARHAMHPSLLLAVIGKHLGGASHAMAAAAVADEDA